MNEDSVTYELAVKLKEKGFDWQTFDWYDMAGNFCKGFMPRELMCREYYAPTIAQVLKWLRKKCFIHISTKPYPCEDGIMWLYEIRKFNEYKSVVVANKTGFIKEEQANIVGIEVVLDNLI